MEFFLGSLIALFAILSLKFFTNKLDAKFIVPRHSQSRSFEMLKDFIPFSQITIQPLTFQSQAVRFTEENTLRILYTNNLAYWIKNNALYVADVIDGQIDEESTKQVDTMGMNDVELKQTIFIVEKLREGLTNDFGYPGDKKF